VNRRFRFFILLCVTSGAAIFIYHMGGVIRYNNEFTLFYFVGEIFTGLLLLYAYFRREHGMSQMAVQLIVRLFVPRWEEWVPVLGLALLFMAILSVIE